MRPCSGEQELRLHDNISCFYTLGLYLRTPPKDTEEAGKFFKILFLLEDESKAPVHACAQMQHLMRTCRQKDPRIINPRIQADSLGQKDSLMVPLSLL